MKRPGFLLSLLVICILMVGEIHGSVSAQGQASTNSQTQPPADPMLGGDYMHSLPSPNGAGAAEATVPAGNYRVTPIYFVPKDVSPDPYALNYINTQMQDVQRWYGEQLRDRTFQLEPAKLVIGTRALVDYYGACNPISASCYMDGSAGYYGYNLWSNVFADLNGLGYAWQSDRILGIFMQVDGFGGTSLGGSNEFLLDVSAADIAPDCLDVGCATNVERGATAHELGHALGLGHTLYDPEGSPDRSIMNTGFYRFPQCSFVNTSTNPELDTMLASPFFNQPLILKNGGFEACLEDWTVSQGYAACARAERRSGFSGMMIGANQASTVYQDVSAAGKQSYDYSGWYKTSQDTSALALSFKVEALSQDGKVLGTYSAPIISAASGDWSRFGFSMKLPTGTVTARVRVDADSKDATLFVDDLDFQTSQAAPPRPMPMFYNDGDETPDLTPTLRWTDVTGAASYRLQIAGDDSFGPDVLAADVQVFDPAYTLSQPLEYNRRYSWRVKAINHAGESSWSIPWHIVPRAPDLYASDEFNTAWLDPAWSWIREDPANWSFGSPAYRGHPGYMGINSLTGDLLTSTNNARNVLLRSAPQGDYEVSTTYEIWFQPWENDTQGGLIVYQDDDNYIKLVHLYNNWNKLSLLEELKGKVVYQYTIPIVDSLPIKISRVGASYSGSYSPDGISWRPLGAPVQANLQNVKIGLVSFGGSAPDPVTHYFDWFRVSNPCCLVGDMISLGRTSVQELQPVGTVVGMLAVSGTTGSFTYTLAAGAGGEDNSSFSIAGAVLKTKAVFHRDIRDHYNIRVRATSGNGPSAEQNFVITVLPKTMLYLPLAGY